jgi:hypothetical protein
MNSPATSSIGGELAQLQLADPNVEPQYTTDDKGDPGTLQTPSDFSLFPSGEPSPDDVTQKEIGDCYFDAELASIAQEDPDYIKNMVHDNGNGTYTVQLYDPNGKPVDIAVDNKLPTGPNGKLLGLTDTSGQADWASIVEKAYAKYNDVYHVTGKPGDTGYTALTDGGYTVTAVQVLTGQNATLFSNSSYSTPEQQNNLAQQMQQNIKDGQIVTAGTSNEKVLPDGGHTTAAHVYSVVSVEQDANGNWYVLVRDPQGYVPWIDNQGGTNSDDGVMKMSISDYVKYFDYTTVSAPIASSGNDDWQSPGTPLNVSQPIINPYAGSGIAGYR